MRIQTRNGTISLTKVNRGYLARAHNKRDMMLLERRPYAKPVSPGYYFIPATAISLIYQDFEYRAER